MQHKTIDVELLNLVTMKKIVMFLIVSVFFLIGGIAEGMAQKARNKTTLEPEVVQTPSFVEVFPGERATFCFTIKNVALYDVDLILIFCQKPGQNPRLLLTIDKNGNVRREQGVSSRISAFLDFSNNGGRLIIDSVQLDDVGDYYVAVVKNGMYYFSNGGRLEIRRDYKL